ncbi:hypothetical protein HPT25_28180 [Bacillus sp. BRMEA1]|uniref:hypothetical protein n=1 Tax=Neobacillus endophyticus TaxID=2738405 RepID=UPI001567651F|nr:hypothetical protein [Neobacillus endophyticus]NRD81174.1 hypothetical protein [Neobacillus endophyticus]
MIPFIGDISFIALVVFIVLAIRSKLKGTGKTKKMWLYAAGCLVVLVICFAIDPGSSQKASVSQKQKSKAIEATKTVKQVPKTVKDNPAKNSNVLSVDTPVSDQYLEGFLTFMDQFHSNLLQEVNENPNSSNVSIFIGKENAEGWKRFDKVNTTTSKGLDAQFDKRNDVMMAWQSLFEWDMAYNSYIMHDSNMDLKTINQKETAFFNDFQKAQSNFKNKQN